jgi:hypothetical protein
LSLTLIDKQYAEPGIEMSVVWGEHPGQACPPTPISASRVSAPPSSPRRSMITPGTCTGATRNANLLADRWPAA